ncbi:MAG TPA: DUF2283 domain-containing protein [Trebonia sp.]|nr:DUF2283 domain-containing protein [Trebonia sp.]
MIRQSYDLTANALYITVTDREVARTAEIDPGTLVDVDAAGCIAGIEVLSPQRSWPLAEILRRFRIAREDAGQLRAYFPHPAELVPPAHPAPRVPVDI